MDETKKSFEEQLWDQLKDNWEYKKIPLFNGKIDPETGKYQNLHVLIPKDHHLLGTNLYLTSLEIVEKEGY